MPSAEGSVNAVFTGEQRHNRPTFQTVSINGRKYGSRQNNRRVGTRTDFILRTSCGSTRAFEGRSESPPMAAVPLLEAPRKALRRFCNAFSSDRTGADLRNPFFHAVVGVQDDLRPPDPRLRRPVRRAAHGSVVLMELFMNTPMRRRAISLQPGRLRGQLVATAARFEHRQSDVCRKHQ